MITSGKSFVQKSSAEPSSSTVDGVRIGAIAGAAGGLAEIAWVSLYAAATGADPAIVARGVTTAAGANSLLSADPAMLGVGVHMAIAVALGIALTAVWRVLPTSRFNPFAYAAVALTAVWAINFFVVLPIVSPAFIGLLPYSVSLISKLLFGVAAGAVLRLLASPSPEVSHARTARHS